MVISTVFFVVKALLSKSLKFVSLSPSRVTFTTWLLTSVPSTTASLNALDKSAPPSLSSAPLFSDLDSVTVTLSLDTWMVFPVYWKLRPLVTSATISVVVFVLSLLLLLYVFATILAVVEILPL